MKNRKDKRIAEIRMQRILDSVARENEIEEAHRKRGASLVKLPSSPARMETVRLKSVDK